MNNAASLTWTVLADAESVASTARDRIIEAAAMAIDERGSFKIVLAGGSTPKRTYQLLRETTNNWQQWEIFFGDERCLPYAHPERNSQMAAQALLNHVGIPRQRIHMIPADLGPEQSAAFYSGTVAAALPFDMVLLGVGEDGHTASLFPRHKPRSTDKVYAVHGAPKPPPDRITLAAETLADSRYLLYLVTGAEKRDILSAWRAGDEGLPAASIPVHHHAEIIIDQAAYA